ncbi:2-C-methyl-D-erythritol 4-phosphate cytidylyltransferase [Larkinella arboricola]|uniref:2-C-methyl-D-erythritol 4-phosphate cytidylyltransferase n=1 Tax=Larkinella arboricola TaxID=643671 RepID=A0A327WX73_LARAB|nr:2-C-methyl-D-erythritol 4-phosphate cytidylyltransferase [Larkinella arboricola]RAJ94105.1 2-C-methyl-D-erythritol 4-phosphate cytidylyltransferase [Larkinella arboricola]
MKNRFAIIVAGGSGTRMGTDAPKQFLSIGGMPILMHTIRRFRAYSADLNVIVVLPVSQIPVWEELCRQHQFQEAVMVIAGGKTRFQSVRNGLQSIETEDGLVAVHDGVRPFVTTSIIRNSFETAERTGSAVTCVPLKDSARLIHADGSSQAVDRASYRLVQTPQTFQLALFKRAFEVEEQPFFTDCASVVEYAGYPITLIDGSYDNIKITTPEDLEIAEQKIRSAH